jgi:hypothetical protein
MLPQTKILEGLTKDEIQILPLPNEDFGRLNQPFLMCFRSNFQGREYSIWATNRWKLFRTHIRKGWLSLPKSSFGEHKIAQFFVRYMGAKHTVSHTASRYLLVSLCSPNEDFGRRNKRWNEDVRCTFQWIMAQIEYSRPWKVLRTSSFHLLFLLPKSSFGWGRVRHWIDSQTLGHIVVVWTSESCVPVVLKGRACQSC